MKGINLFCLRPEADSWVLSPQTPEVAPPLNSKKKQGQMKETLVLGRVADPDPLIWGSWIRIRKTSLFLPLLQIRNF
jgi:hypothetical protein